MNGNRWKALGVGGILAIVVAVFQLWNMPKPWDAWTHQINSNREQLNDHEMRLCKLEGGEWWKGECRYRRR